MMIIRTEQNKIAGIRAEHKKLVPVVVGKMPGGFDDALVKFIGKRVNIGVIFRSKIKPWTLLVDLVFLFVGIFLGFCGAYEYLNPVGSVENWNGGTFSTDE